MGTITERKTKDGKTRYRAAIRINKDGFKYSESRTFSKRNLAQAWLTKREAEIELNPDVLHKAATEELRLQEAIDRYLEQVGGDFGRTHRLGLIFIGKQPIGAKYVSKLSNIDFANFAEERLQTVKPQTLNSDMIAIRGVLRYAKMVWGMDVNLAGFEEVMLGLRYARKIKPSDKRTRLPTFEELQQLTNYFYNKFYKRKTTYPMHLILWFAIYTARREAEITRLAMTDFSKTNDGNWWLVRDMKNPKGSQGNHKEVKIPDSALPVITALQDDKVRERMQGCKDFNEALLVPLVSKNFSAEFRRACKILGIEDLHFHDLRHEAATRLAEQGLTIPQIQQITGHESWNSLQRYTNLKKRPKVLEFQEAIEQAIKNHDNCRGICQ